MIKKFTFDNKVLVRVPFPITTCDPIPVLPLFNLTTRWTLLTAIRMTYPSEIFPNFIANLNHISIQSRYFLPHFNFKYLTEKTHFILRQSLRYYLPSTYLYYRQAWIESFHYLEYVYKWHFHLDHSEWVHNFQAYPPRLKLLHLTE